MRTTEIFTVLAAILVLIIMRSKAEPFWPFTSPKKSDNKIKKMSAALESAVKKPPMGSSAGKGMVFGKRGNAVPKSDFARRQMGSSAGKGMVFGKRGNAVPSADFDLRQGVQNRKTTRYTGPIGPPKKSDNKIKKMSAGYAVPGRPGAVFGKAGGVASRASYERKFGASLF